MKERPIIFDGPSVRAMLAGHKTQTRRVVKPQPSNPIGLPGALAGDVAWAMGNGTSFTISNRGAPPEFIAVCPYGVPGDRLWVRETLSIREAGLTYDCDGITVGRDVVPISAKPLTRPRLGSMFMPRWACRLLLEIVSVRVQRVREITVADCYAEGFPFPTLEATSAYHLAGRVTQAHDWFAEHWDSIYAQKHPWASNPWVWVVEFKKLDSAGGAA